MLVQCGMDGGAGEEPRRAAAWLGAATLESLAELNEAGLSLLAEQAAAVTAEPRALVREVGALWRTLDTAARRRAAGAPYLLLDGGFGDPERWRHGAAREVADPARAGHPAFFTVSATVEVARLHFTFAWHLARAQSAAARLLLGMPPGCAALIAGCTLRRVHTLAERHPEWLRPRWPSRPELWRDLLSAAAAGEGRAFERARLHGLTMLAAEARAAAGAPPAASAAGRMAAAPARPRLTSPAGTASTAPSPRSPARP
ncbi:MAG TPA: hypothetical protein VNY70_00220 [Steroidobacteraceae bacterium]|jgi:hypothetical protein|nr:hypothetical protein [Steroidobacteraceae bacterium]